MSSTPWCDEHSQLIAAAAPTVEPAAPHELDRAWAQIQTELVPEKRAPRRRTRLFLGVGVTAVAVGVGGVATAGVFSAHTGKYAADAEDRRLGGPGERLDPAAPDYATVLAQVTRDVPFPADRDREAFVQAEVRSDQRDAHPGESGVSTGELRFWAARSAVCAWADRWAAATAAGDAEARSHAATMLEQAPTWPSVTAVDNKQVIRYRVERVEEPRAGEITRRVLADNTPAGYFPLVRRAALSDDLAAMGSVLAQWGACPAYGATMPDLPQAIPHA